MHFPEQKKNVEEIKSSQSWQRNHHDLKSDTRTKTEVRTKANTEDGQRQPFPVIKNEFNSLQDIQIRQTKAFDKILGNRKNLFDI